MNAIPIIREFIPLVIAALWPVTVLTLALCFGREIKKLIASGLEAKIGNSIFVKWGQSSTDAKSLEHPCEVSSAKQITAPHGAKWENVANLFWLGSDLEWTSQTALRGAPKERIVYGLRHCDDHCSDLGL